MRSLYKSLLLSSVLFYLTASAKAQTQNAFYNVKDFGAKGDGVNIDGSAINKAIDEAANAGGGTVYLPAGSYVSGSIHLKSNIRLFLDQGATLIASSDSTLFDKPEKSINDIYQDYGHSHFHNSFIWGQDLHDIVITGAGKIWGKGLERDGNKGDENPNKSISLLRCRNVIIRDLTIFHGGWFAILATGVDNLTIDNLKVDTNRDGFDIDCCQNVRMSNCSVNSPRDDGICLKSSFALGYARPTENVTITNCQVSGYVEGTLLDGTFHRTDPENQEPTGRIKFGTESNGGFKNITINNCVFDDCRGLALETVDGAQLEDITISNITMRDIGNSPVFIRIGARMRGPGSLPIGECRRIIINNIVAYNVDDKQGAIISGLPGHYIQDLQLSNIRIYYKGGGPKNAAKVSVPEHEKDYPEPDSWKTMPSYGFYIRHVKDLKMHDVQIHYLKEDFRPPFILADVKGAILYDIQAERNTTVPSFILKNVEDIHISQTENVRNTFIKKAAKMELP